MNGADRTKFLIFSDLSRQVTQLYADEEDYSKTANLLHLLSMIIEYFERWNVISSSVYSCVTCGI